MPILNPRWYKARLVISVLGAGVVAFTVVAWPSVAAVMTASAVYLAFALILLKHASRAGVLCQFGAANTITGIRAALAAILAGAVVNADFLATTWWPGGLAAISLVLDGLDGAVARRQGLASEFGALFDQEIDAAFIFILTGLLAASGKIGIWIVVAGLMRYILLGAGLVWPVLASPLPKSRFRSSVCGLLVAALVVCLFPIVAANAANLIGGAALIALTLSFGKDLIWLLTKAPRRSST
jgi:phosphatidylglycerophosphate synthase